MQSFMMGCISKRTKQKWHIYFTKATDAILALIFILHQSSAPENFHLTKLELHGMIWIPQFTTSPDRQHIWSPLSVIIATFINTSSKWCQPWQRCGKCWDWHTWFAHQPHHHMTSSKNDHIITGQQKSKSALLINHQEQQISPDTHYLGKFAQICDHCMSSSFVNESFKCCQKDKVKLTPLSSYPFELQRLLTDCATYVGSEFSE